VCVCVCVCAGKNLNVLCSCENYDNRKELKKPDTRTWDGPTHACRAIFGARLVSYDSWPTLKQSTLKFCEVEFFYTGMFGGDKNSAYYSKTGVKQPCKVNDLLYTDKEQGSLTLCNN
jgi:hypothetical protein